LDQLDEWRNATSRIIGFVQAQSTDGALAQLPLASEAINDIEAIHEDRQKGDLGEHIAHCAHLLRSAVRALRPMVVEPDVGAVIETYCGQADLRLRSGRKCSAQFGSLKITTDQALRALFMTRRIREGTVLLTVLFEMGR
jgi:hypothetical protein